MLAGGSALLEVPGGVTGVSFAGSGGSTEFVLVADESSASVVFDWVFFRADGEATGFSSVPFCRFARGVDDFFSSVLESSAALAFGFGVPAFGVVDAFCVDDVPLSLVAGSASVDGSFGFGVAAFFRRGVAVSSSLDCAFFLLVDF